MYPNEKLGEKTDAIKIRLQNDLKFLYGKLSHKFQGPIYSLPASFIWTQHSVLGEGS